METTAAKTPTYTDVYTTVTNTIIEQLENGVVPWERGYNASSVNFTLPVNYTTGNNYRGINIILLWCAAMKKGHQTQEWASMKQWNAKGQFIRKGEKGNLVVYYDTFDKDVDGEIQKIPFLKASYVFNKSQLKNFEPVQLPVLQSSTFEKDEVIAQFVANTKAVIDWHSGNPCYLPLEDKIKMPFHEQYRDTIHATATEHYHADLLHELTHWTGSDKRLKRLNNSKFGDKNYATEELVAELGAAFLCAGFGLNTVEKGNHAAYIASWLKVLKENSRAIVTAAGAASTAVEYLQSYSAT